jgi:exodeoxyribonuclease VII small subunit
MGKKAPPMQSLEQIFTNLETIVERIEDGEISLEEAMRLFKEGVMLCREGSLWLDQAEQEVNLLLRDPQSGTWQQEAWRDPSASSASEETQESDEDDEDEDDEDGDVEGAVVKKKTSEKEDEEEDEDDLPF